MNKSESSSRLHKLIPKKIPFHDESQELEVK